MRQLYQLMQEKAIGDVLGLCCLEMEEVLSYSYREGRVATGSIGALEIRVVRPCHFSPRVAVLGIGLKKKLQLN